MQARHLACQLGFRLELLPLANTPDEDFARLVLSRRFLSTGGTPFCSPSTQLGPKMADRVELLKSLGYPS